MDQYGFYDMNSYPRSTTQYHQVFCSCQQCSTQQTYPQSQPLPYNQIMHDSRPSTSGHDEKPVQQPQIPQPPPPTYQYSYASVPTTHVYQPTWQMIGQAYGQPVLTEPQHPSTYQHYQTPIPQAHLGYMPLSQQQQLNPISDLTSLNSASLAFDQFVPTSADGLAPTPLAHYQTDLNDGLSGYVIDQRLQQSMHSMQAIQYGTLSSSPPETVDDNHSATSSEWGWQLVDNSPIRTSFESFHDVSPTFSRLPNPATAVSNPGLTLHIRSESGSSQDDGPQSATSLDSFEHIQFPIESPLSLPVEPATSRSSAEHTSPAASCEAHSSSASCSPSQGKVSPVSSPHSSPRARQKRNSYRSTRALAKKQAPVLGPKPADTSMEKKVGRRKGPLRPDQRKQAGEIRKLRACLRCKFLKKTCDKGETCAGCQPSHARLWQVPCTRIDIKDLGFFIKGWDADYARHKTMAIPADAVLEYSPNGGKASERSLWISHGYGYCFSVDAREIFFRDSHYSIVQWEETSHPEPEKFNVATASLAPTRQGISSGTLNDYLEAHIGDKFPSFVEGHFEGTKFLSEMLVTSYRYWKKTQNATVKKALKLVVAYNLTMAGTWMEALTEGDGIHEGKVKNPSSRFYGKQRAPLLINHAISAAMGQLWRDLQKDVLEELSSLFQSVYTGDKLKNWPTIFIVATLLLAVWEEMQFDARKRETDDAIVERFLEDMEKTPVGVITGLFAAISQKVPAFTEWDSNEHQHILGSDQAACNVMTEVRNHVRKHEEYLQSRSDCKYDGNDFDCLSNKFISKLVIKL